jgi:hypothetical protein
MREEENMTETEIVEAELVPYEHAPAPTTLFGTSDPEIALERMARIAQLLVGVVRDRKLVKRIGGSEYLLAPAWTVLAGMTGLAPHVAWTRRLEDGTGWMARVEARRITDGTVISAAEQVCTRSESKWARADEHALLGMAQTRAQNRALRGPLMEIVELAGYQSTPAEEMPADEPKRDGGKIPPELRPSKEQITRISDLIAELAALDPETDWIAKARALAGVPGNMLTRTIADQLIRQLELALAEL